MRRNALVLMILSILAPAGIEAQQGDAERMSIANAFATATSENGRSSVVADTAAQQPAQRTADAAKQGKKPFFAGGLTFAHVKVEMNDGSDFLGYRCSFEPGEEGRLKVQRDGEWKTYPMKDVDNILTKGTMAHGGLLVGGAIGLLAGVMGVTEEDSGRHMAYFALGGAALGYIIGYSVDTWKVVYSRTGQAR